MKINCAGHTLHLLAEKAVWWPARSTLLIADVHLGKVTHFRKAGIAVPVKAVEGNFNNLNALIQKMSPRRIIVLGDFFHHAHNSEWDSFARWKETRPSLDLVIISGNHDILPEKQYKGLASYHSDAYFEEGLVFRHHPTDIPDTGFVLCGHLHPVFILKSPAGQRLRLPCFVQDPHQLILPGFGVFTGGHTVSQTPSRHIFVVASDTVLPVRR